MVRETLIMVAVAPGQFPKSPRVTDKPDSPDRFNEEKATYTVRGADAPDLEAGIAAIRAVVKTLPVRPGRLPDARCARRRPLRRQGAGAEEPGHPTTPRSRGRPKRLQRMVSQTRSMQIVTTNSEAEALLLEAQLIKRYRPPYNVLLRDDKSFPFILLREDHDFPARPAPSRRAAPQGPILRAVRQRRIGPQHAQRAAEAVPAAGAAPTASSPTASRPCLLYQIRRCSAPCVGRIDEAGYAELVRDAKDFLGGRSTKIQQKLQALMSDASEAMDFELAAVYRDRLRALTYIQGSQAIHAEKLGDADLFALACKGGTMCIQAFFIRGGQNWGHRSFFPAHTTDVPEAEVLQSFLVQFYEEVPPPRLILIDRALPEADLLGEAFSERAERKVALKAPQRGDQARMIRQAARNAEEELDRRLAETSTQARNLRELAETFELAEPPQRIEVYDNSHVMGTNAVGAMIVAGPEGFRKNQYRKFNIKRPETAPGDDFAMMREVLGRRFARLEKEDPDRSQRRLAGPAADRRRQGPALGGLRGAGGCRRPRRAGGRRSPRGRTAMPAARSSICRAGARSPCRPIRRCSSTSSGCATRPTASRSAPTAQKRAKSFTASPLDEVPGIGPGRKRALLMHFGTARAVRNAALEDLEKVPGISATVARRSTIISTRAASVPGEGRGPGLTSLGPSLRRGTASAPPPASPCGSRDRRRPCRHCCCGKGAGELGFRPALRRMWLSPRASAS